MSSSLPQFHRQASKMSLRRRQSPPGPAAAAHHRLRRSSATLVIHILISLVARHADRVEAFAFPRTQSLLVEASQVMARLRLVPGGGTSGGTVAILVPSSYTSAPSKFDLGAPDADDAAAPKPLSYGDAARAIARKVADLSAGSIAVGVETAGDLEETDDINTLQERRRRRAVALVEADVLLGLGLSRPADVRCLSTLFRERRLAEMNNSSPLRWWRGSKRTCQFALGCGQPFAPLVGPYDEANPSFWCKISWTDEARGRTTMYEMMDGFEEGEVEAFARAIVMFFDRFG